MCQGDGSLDTQIEFMLANETSLCLELADTHRLTDDEAIEIIRRTAKTQNAQAIQKFSFEQRNKALHDLKEQGISIRQLSRLTGINRGIILRAQRVERTVPLTHSR